MSSEAATFLVDTRDGYKIDRCAPLPDSNLKEHVIVPSHDGSQAWQTGDVLQTLNGKRWFYPSPGVFLRTCQSVKHLFTDLYPLDVFPIAGSNRAWLVSSARSTTGVGHPHMGARVAIVDTAGSVAVDVNALLPESRFAKAVASADGSYAWLLTEDARIYVVGKDGAVANGGRPLPLPVDVTLEEVFPSSNGRVGWIMPALPHLGKGGVKANEYEQAQQRQSGVFAFNLDTGSLGRFRPSPYSSIFMVYPNDAGDEAWVVGSEDQIYETSASGSQGGRWSAGDETEIIPAGRGRAWFVVSSTYHESGLFLIESPSSKLDFNEAPLSNILRADVPMELRAHPLDGGKVLLLSSSGRLSRVTGSWVAHAGDELQGVSLSFGGSELATNRASTLAVDPGIPGQSTTVSLPLEGGEIPSGGRLEVVVYDGTASPIASAGAEVLSTAKTAELALSLQRGKEWKFGTPYHIEVRYSDNYGSRISIGWPAVEFRPPVLSRPKVRSALCVALVWIVWMLLLRFRSVAPTAAKWSPLALWLGSGGGLNLPAISRAVNVDGTTIIVLLGASALLSVPAGFLSPDTFRTLAQTAPFHWCAPWAMLLPGMRRRMYKEYMAELEENLTRSRIASQHETYVQMPLVLTGRTAGNEQGMQGPVDASYLRSQWAAPNIDLRSTIIVESAGGRGKSALLRELVRTQIEQFKQEEGSLLPVPLTPASIVEDSVEKSIRRVLARHLISDEVFRQELETGGFLPVVDGLTELKISPGTIETYVRSQPGKVCPLLVTKRTDRELDCALYYAARWIQVEPARLDEATRNQFETVYVVEDRKRGLSVKPLSAGLLNICRTGDGSYLPILVRLCIIAGDDSADSVKDVYEGAFKVLLLDDNKGVRLDEGSALCIETYWRTGARLLPVAAIPASRRSTVQLLLQSQILVPTIRNRINDEPQEVAFFHDSMQSFLTALGLFQLPDAWAHLGRAAGDPAFTVRRSDDSGETGSELFQMCLAVFGPKEVLRKHLRSDLERWADELDDELQKLEIKSAVPPTVDIRFDRQSSPAVLLKQLATACGDRLEELAHVYVRIAPLAWKGGARGTSSPNDKPNAV
jgi:hypothetical protein